MSVMIASGGVEKVGSGGKRKWGFLVRKNCGKSLFFVSKNSRKCLFLARGNCGKSLFYFGDSHVSLYFFSENSLRWVVCRDYRGRKSGFVKMGKAKTVQNRSVFVSFRQKPRGFAEFSSVLGDFGDPKNCDRSKVRQRRLTTNYPYPQEI